MAEASVDESTTVEATGTDESWCAELELALKSGSDYAEIRQIAQNRPLPSSVRSKVWQILLGVTNKPDVFASWQNVYDLPEQQRIRELCQGIVNKLGNEESDKLGIQSDLESVVTLYCKTREISFSPDNGWGDILQLLIALGLPKAQLFHLFYAFTTKYIPRGCVKDGRPFDLFRLLLLYHEPQLCSLLDTRKITPDQYGMRWFNSLFANCTSLNITLRIWDVYLQQGDPFLLFFMALAFLLTARDQIGDLNAETTEKIVQTISNLPCQLGADDIEDFCSCSSFFAKTTPQSFRRDYHGPLYGSNLAEEFESVTVHSLLCLPVSVQELLLANQRAIDGVNDDACVKYFVVDTRPQVQYDNGHLPGAYSLDAALIVENPEQFGFSVCSLLAFKEKTYPNEHICFMGSGREEEDKFLHMLVSHFLQRGAKYVSLTRGGYAALHQVLRDSLTTRLKSHSAKNCLICRGEKSQPDAQANKESKLSGSHSLFSKMSEAVRNKSSVIKEKVTDYVLNVNPPSPAKERHVSPTERNGARYRNLPSAFNIGSGSDSDNGSDVESGSEDDAIRHEKQQRRERVKISAYVNQSGVLGYFSCHLITPKKMDMIPIHLVITRTQIVIVQDCDTDPNWGYIVQKRPLDLVTKITSKKKIPELLTFRYATPNNPEKIVAERFFIPKAGDAAKLVKTAIFEMKKDSDGLVSTNDCDVRSANAE